METERCEVFLVSVGPKKIEVIRVIRGYTDLDLKDSKELAESAPRVVWSDVPRDTAENMKRDLEHVGAIAEVRQDSGIGTIKTGFESGPICSVTLGDPGPEKIEVIKIVRNYTGLGLKEAKELVESGPGAVCPGVSGEAAEKMVRELEAIGATARITGDSALGRSSKGADHGPRYEVILADLGPEKIEVIKVIRQYTGLGLKEAKEMAESAPRTVCSGVDKEAAEKMKADLELVGATARIRTS
jgi:large subunit ribosomal protein L7/L12